MRIRFLAILLCLLATRTIGAQPNVADTKLRFEVTVAPGLLDKPTDGRVLVVLGREKGREPRRSMTATGAFVDPLLGTDGRGLAPGVVVTLDQTSLIYPIAHLSNLKTGEYFVQAVFDYNPDIRLPTAPGNLFSDPIAVKLDPAQGGVVKLELNRRQPDEQPPPETELVKYVKLKSELLSKFHGRPMYLRAGVILPRDFAKQKDMKYPLRVHIGGFGTRYTAVSRMLSGRGEFGRTWLADGTPPFILLLLDGAGPFGDPYQVNSDNNGPYGDAVTQELIPFVEQQFRGIGAGWARVLDGASTGGWVSLGLQVFYPDFFNGTWSHAPDPVDFRCYELINIYSDRNAYINKYNFERPSMRNVDGDTIFTVRHECHIERVLGRGDRWELAGRDWASWNATFGPRGADGLPRPLWNGATGEIDPSVLEHWKRYDLRNVLQTNWPVLGPKLRGKLHIWVGEADDYFLNDAVHLLDTFLKTAKPAYEGSIVFGPRQGHGFHIISEKQLIEDMAAAVERGRRAQERQP
jgi:hypothetical protein